MGILSNFGIFSLEFYVNAVSTLGIINIYWVKKLQLLCFKETTESSSGKQCLRWLYLFGTIFWAIYSGYRIYSFLFRCFPCFPKTSLYIHKFNCIGFSCICIAINSIKEGTCVTLKSITCQQSKI